jgi:hypothetical protein
MKAAHIKILGFSILVVVIAVLSLCFVAPVLRERSECVALGKEWQELLEQHPDFAGEDAAGSPEVVYYYADSTDENLARLRRLYELDAIAGEGSETERVISLMAWVYRLAGHANYPQIPDERNAFTFIRLAQEESMQLNCFMKTVILNEVYLALGFASRQTHLLPHSNEDEASHYVTSVYSRDREDWLMMDPDFGVYMTDANGEILGVREIRRKLIAHEPLKTMRPGRSRLANAWENVYNFVEGADYPWFLSCFVFKMRCPITSRFNQYSEPIRDYYELLPQGYGEDLLHQTRTAPKRKRILSISDEDLFWQKPAAALD